MEMSHCRKSDPPAGVKKRQWEETDIALLPREITMLGVLPSTENENFVSAKSLNIKRSKSNDENESSMMIGRPINGVVDGVFDAGYLMSVRIGDSDAIFRGVVFRPGLIIPPSKMNHMGHEGTQIELTGQMQSPEPQKSSERSRATG